MDARGCCASVRIVEKGATKPVVIEVDMVVVSCGVRPRDELARGCGLEVGERTGGVKVDGGLRSSDPVIYALGEVAPVGGAPGDFLSAGGLVTAPRRPGETAAGDLTLLQVREDGSGMLVTTTDAFAMQDLVTGEKTAIIINAGAENPATIPAAGDAGKRMACGVIGAG